MLKKFILCVLQVSLLFPIFGWGFKKNKKNDTKTELKVIPIELQTLIDSYPFLNIQAEFNKEENDYILQFTNNSKNFIFYWAQGSVLPEEELQNKNNYWKLIYKYNNVLKDPSTYTEDEITMLKDYGTVKNRKKSPGTPMFFFDAIYSSFSRKTIENHIISTSFLGKPTRVHENIIVPLKNVERKILEAEENSQKVKVFIKELKSAAAYHWREIDGTKRKSFHSLGIAIDLLPVAYHGGEVFWSWARDKNPQGWMKTPLHKRWMPPKEVIDAFESEGFIWGGYWAIWDNMHFEYHPEIINSTINAKH